MSRASLAVSAVLSLFASACGDGRAAEDHNSDPRCEYTERVVGVDDRSLGFSAADVLNATPETQTCSWIWYDPYPFGTMLPEPGVTSAEVSLRLAADDATLVEAHPDAETALSCTSSLRFLGALQIATEDGAIEHTFLMPMVVSARGDYKASVDISAVSLPGYGFAWDASWEHRQQQLVILGNQKELYGGAILVQGVSPEYPGQELWELSGFDCVDQK